MTERRLTWRRDYRPPDFLINQVELHFELDADLTLVRSRLSFRRNSSPAGQAPLALDGRDLELVELRLDDCLLDDRQYSVSPTQLLIPSVPDTGILTVVTRIRPSANTALEGLYQSDTMLCTQCEAHGFSRITYFPDRPDVMARYRVTLSADRRRYPVLLANGNPVARAQTDERHSVTWEDPFPKPCYLFALVAGDLAVVEDNYQTSSGKTVALQIYVEAENRDKCAHAMASLKQAMRWDEETYGREYDLAIFMIVAVGSFNMGAMENKGLNIFNAKYIVVDPQTATDADHEAVRDIVAHEYFHNWTGNRITCRDWFQLSVKESLTVFREQQFSAAMGSAAIARINQARLIRTQQFPEDAGPTAHPVQPDSYLEVNNLYTLTVYEKGAEVIRMLHTLLGPEQFRRGMDLYFERHDGDAVTVEQFVHALETASGRDLEQFRRWYHQAGTPKITVDEHYDAAAQCYTLDLRQSNPALAESDAQPLHIPLRAALVTVDGAVSHERLLELKSTHERFVFDDVAADAVPSLLRQFSAPLRINRDCDDAQLMRLINHADDSYSCWDAAQQLLLRNLLARVRNAAIESAVGSNSVALVDAFQALLRKPPADAALLAEMLAMPSETLLADQLAVSGIPVDATAVINARDGLRRDLAIALYPQLLTVYRATGSPEVYRFDAVSVAHRRFRNISLGWLAATEHPDAMSLAVAQYRDANNMTDAQAALQALNDFAGEPREAVLAHFHNRWADQVLVLDKWLSLQASARIPTATQTVIGLLSDPAFDLHNPNRVRALLGSFAQGNFPGFHATDGSGYRLVADAIERLDRINPQVAARLAASFSQWRRYTGPQQQLQQEQLQRLQTITGLSADVYEIVSKSLQIN